MGLAFPEASRLERIADGHFVGEVPDKWQQGRGAFGGLVLGMMLRAGCSSEEDAERVARTFAGDIAGPVMPGRADLRVRVLRRGKSQTNLHIELEQAGEVLASGTCTLSATRRVDVPTVSPSAPPEALVPWEELPIMPLRAPVGPVFAKHYEYRNVGTQPYGGASEATTAGFVRQKSDGELDAPAITALLDSYWPALFSSLTRPVPMATVSFAAQYLNHDAPLPASEALYLRSRMLTQREGYCVEFRELWAKERLIALNQQTFAVLR
jgi:acyl-CoA thioesterase